MRSFNRLSQGVVTGHREHSALLTRPLLPCISTNYVQGTTTTIAPQGMGIMYVSYTYIKYTDAQDIIHLNYNHTYNLNN